MVVAAIQSVHRLVAPLPGFRYPQAAWESHWPEGNDSLHARLVNQLQLLLLCLAGWLNRKQQHVIESFQEEIRPGPAYP